MHPRMTAAPVASGPHGKLHAFGDVSWVVELVSGFPNPAALVALNPRD
jgi:hypothetical protein